MQIYFGASPERVEELSNLAMETIAEFRANAPDNIYVTKVKATQREDYELNIEENSFWVNSIKNAIRHEREFESILTYPKLIDGLDAADLSLAAGKYLDEGRYIRVILYPVADGSSQ